MTTAAYPSDMTGDEQGTTDAIRLEPLRKVTSLIPVRGVSPIIPHKWSEKALRQMRDKQSGARVKARHEPKDPVAEAESATYYLPDGRPGMPATAFKAAMVGAVRHFEGITIVAAKQLLFVEGDGPDQLVAIEGGRTLREDTPRNSGGGTADLRYRYSYWPWTAVLPVTFIPNVIDLGSVITLLNAGGMGGVGDWRPSAPKSMTGTYGRFEVDADAMTGETL
jgi:hypothetical protein